MAVVTPAQASFNGGELSPRILSRYDQNITSIAVKKMLGWLPLLQGPAEACPGTLFVAKAKGPHRLIPYEFNVTQGYQVEAGDLYARFYTNDVRIETSPGVAYEIVTPWTIDQVRGLYYEQSNDVLYCAHRDVPLHILFRTSADTFDVAPYELNNGPFETRNPNKGLTVSASGVTGNVVITASAAIFEAGDVGGLFEMESGSFSTIPAWEAGMEVANGAFVQSNGNVYQKTGGAGRTGTVAPLHIEGTEYDGMNSTDINNKGPYGAAWTYLHGMFGLVRFTGYVSPTQMEAIVLDRLPNTGATWRWRFGAFSPRRGYPEIVGVWQERLILVRDGNVWGSVAAGLDDFATRNELGDISRDQAFHIQLPTSDKARWLLAALGLVLGTDKAEHVLAAASAGQGAGPGNIDRDEPADHGSAAARPVKVNGRAIHIQRARGKVMQLAYDSNRLLRAESPNLSRFADHIGNVGLAEMAWVKEPERLMWFRRDDGTLAVMGFEPDEEFLGWATRTLGGGMLARSISVNTDPAGRFEQLWIGVEAGAEHWVLRMPSVRATGDASEQVMSDAALRRTGAPSAAISAPHLANRIVEVCADGRPVLDVQLDANGAAAIDFEASDVIVGLPFPAELQFLPPTGGSENGPAMGKIKRTNRVDLHTILSDELEVECQGDKRRLNHLRASAAFDVALPLRSHRQQVELATDYDDEMVVTVRRIYPRPSTLAVVMPHYQSAQA